MNPLEQLEADIREFQKTEDDIEVVAKALAEGSPFDPSIYEPPLRHCSCGTDVVGAWDAKTRTYRWFVPNPHRGQFLIRQKPLPGWGTPWQATWWGPVGGEYSVHECDGRVVEPNWLGTIDESGGWEAESYGDVA